MEAVVGFGGCAKVLVFKNIPAFPVLLGFFQALRIDHQ